MAENLDIKELRRILSQKQLLNGNEFSVLQNICALINDKGTESLGREMILRALECRHAFGSCGFILEALVREVGLYPYADPNQMGLKDTIAYEYHRPFNLDEIVFHREQADIYRRLMEGDSVVVSAPTSFGKSLIIDAIIAAGKFSNIVVIVPTLALIDETRRRLSQFSDRYKIVTHLSQNPLEKNIFIFTAERANVYKQFPEIKFFVIDEFYKLGALSEDQTRTVALNQAFYKLHKGGGQFFLLGPAVDRIADKVEETLRCYFYKTKFNTVLAEHMEVPRGEDQIQRLVSLAASLDEQTLVFCRSPARVNEVAHALVNANIGIDASEMIPAAEWAKRTYHDDWIFPRALARGIGIHHGRLPRSFGQYVVRVFNELKIRFLICTSTLIEGVNTKAKNVIVFDNKIARKNIDYFTFNNIKGRSGRMFEHFIGNVYLFAPPPMEQLPLVDFPIVTQDESVPSSLLIQLDYDDLNEKASARVDRIMEQDVLPIEVIRGNSTIEPEQQVELAEFLKENLIELRDDISWSGRPTYQQLGCVCDLIWEYFVDSRRRAGVFSSKQLTYKLWEMQKTPTTRDRVLSELMPGSFAAPNADEAVERVLLFQRSWAGFEFPRYLMALSNIQEYILKSAGITPGDYSSYAAQVECFFKNPVVVALDEYGIPLELAEKIQASLRTSDDLDEALSNFKKLDIETLSLDEFEKDILRDAQSAL